MLLLPFVPPEALEARGRSRQRPGANLRSGIDPGSPVALGGARRGGGGGPRGWGKVATRKSAQGGPALRGLSGAGERSGSLASSSACCRVGGVLRGPRAEGWGVAWASVGRSGRCQDESGGGDLRWRPLEVGPRNLAPFPQNVNVVADPILSLQQS